MNLDYSLSETFARNAKKTRKSCKFLPAKVSAPKVAHYIEHAVFVHVVFVVVFSSLCFIRSCFFVF